MIKFSKDPNVAERQMNAIIFYLTTFGYIDGDFDDSERLFVKNYVGKLVAHRVEQGLPDGTSELKAELTGKFTQHFHEVFEGIDKQVKDLFTEAVAKDEDQNQFVHSKLKLRCFEIFKSFDTGGQEVLMKSVDELIHADGHVHPAELKFRAELSALLEEDVGLELIDGNRPNIKLTPVDAPKSNSDTHPFFTQFEFHYSSNPKKIAKQLEADQGLLAQVMEILSAKREKGAGKLTGAAGVSDFNGQAPFLDGHTWVVPASHEKGYELTVLGDLHGCYSNLKATVLQSRFFEKVETFKGAPDEHPMPMLVLLGDYIDRGMYSLNGVLRTVMQLFIRAPDHVFVLRGNHEYYVEVNGEIYGGVKPAEAINTLKPHVSMDVFRNYRDLFEALPNVLLFDKVMFVHAGIPRDRLTKEHYKDMSFLNHPDARFQMMWSDPSSADVIPADLQEQSARFPFGRLQAASFLQRFGCHTLIRGHEKVEGGFERNYDDDDVVLLTVFSAGGTENEDLPKDSSYRSVEPHALTVTHQDDTTRISPWAIDYRTFNQPDTNAFFKAPPEIAHKSG